jgi:hypothetical protein
VTRSGPRLRRLLAAATLAWTSAAGADPGAARDAAAGARGAALEDALPGSLDGRGIYERVLENRFRAYEQTSRLVSGDRGGAEQESRLQMTWQSFRDGDGRPSSGVLSKSLVKYTHPFDLRYSGYLIQNNAGRPNDQFVYLASSRRIRRVNLRSEAVFGTDFTFEDVLPRELEEATYQRLPDEVVQGTACYVVDVAPTPESDSQYSRFVVAVEKAHFVPIRTRYWDERGVEVKELLADPARIQEFEGVFIPMVLTMRNLQLDTYTSLQVEELRANPALEPTTFDLRRLETH